MVKYESPTIEFIEFESDVTMGSIPQSQELCNCTAYQWNNNTSLTDYSLSEDGCEMTSYGFNEIGDHY